MKEIKKMEVAIMNMVNEMDRYHEGDVEYDRLHQELRAVLFEYVCANRGVTLNGDVNNTLCPEMFTEEILKATDDSLKYFDGAKGNFIHYFNFNVSRAIKQAKGKYSFEESHGGAGLSKGQIRKIKRYVQLAGDRQLDLEDESLKELREALQIKEEDLQFYCGSTYSIDYTDEENPHIKDNRELLTEATEGGSDFAAVLEQINGAFLQMSGRIDLLAILLTADLAEEIYGWELEKFAAELNFFDFQTYQFYIKRGTKESQKEIAARCGVFESQLSRTYSRFKKLFCQKC